MNHHQQLIKAYRETEANFRVIDRNDKYSTLVRANGNKNCPVQRWFHLKEAFSIELLETLLEEWDISPESINRVLDPFCGIGTSLLAAQKLAKKFRQCDLVALGIEQNPFLHFVAKTKIKWNEYDPYKLKSNMNSLLNTNVNEKESNIRIPSLSTLHRADVYDPKTLNYLLEIKNSIQSKLHNQMERDPLFLGYASILEGVSGVRKDGRALRIVPNKQRLNVSSALESAWNTISDDLILARDYFEPIKTEVFLGDGRTFDTGNDSIPKINDLDLILYSPPYLNNIDYTEVYKIELWMSGFVETADEFRNLRYETFRSHPSVKFLRPLTINEDRRMRDVLLILDYLIGALPKDRNLKWRTDLFRGYFDDMYISLKNQINALNPGGWIFCVVGNSLHGPRGHQKSSVPVASDLLIALIAESLGLEIKAIQVARHLTRRSSNSNYLRESILVMQK